MTIREGMLTAARRGADDLAGRGEPARRFTIACQQDNGGFCNRAGVSDLYYTVFGLQLARALTVPVDDAAAETYLAGLGSGQSLDLVHFGSLVRCWCCLDRSPGPLFSATPARLESCRAADGGYGLAAGADTGSAYGCFVAVATWQDLDQPVPAPDGVLACLASLRTESGGYANDQVIPFPTALSTAAAVVVRLALGADPDEEALEFLLGQRVADEGFLAVPMAPQPDLLSTATSLFALHSAGVSVDEPDGLRRFVLDHDRGDNGFAGSPDEGPGDLEYTFYALLTLGLLADRAT